MATGVIKSLTLDVGNLNPRNWSIYETRGGSGTLILRIDITYDGLIWMLTFAVLTAEEAVLKFNSFVNNCTLIGEDIKTDGIFVTIEVGS